MFVPYATARHGPGAAQVSLSVVKQLAAVGRLRLLRHSGTEVAARLEFPIERGGKRYWESCRAGYTERVFSDQKLYGDMNLVNTWIGHQYAREHGFELHDLGIALARPEGGLLQWKRNRGGYVDAWGNHAWYWVKAPAGQAASFFWASPLFGVERHGLILHVGIPEGRSDSEVTARFQRLYFSGLAEVRIHVRKTMSPAVLQELRERYGGTKVDVVAN